MINDGLTLAQARAKSAMDEVNTMEGKNVSGFKSYVNALPATIVMNGFGQALAFELSKDDEGHKKLSDALQNWLCDPKYGVYKNENNLMYAIITGSQYLSCGCQASEQ